MAAAGPADREARGEASDSAGAHAPFDLGDSRDLAAAVRAAWAPESTEPTTRVEVPRPAIAPPGRLPFSAPRPKIRNVVAAAGALGALLAAAAVPIVSGGISPTPEVAESRTVRTTTTTRQVAPTTAFTYPPETNLGPTSTAVPAPPSPPAASSPSPAPASLSSTATTSRPRTTSTTRSAPRTTQAPAPTTTQAPPPPPADDGGGSDGSSEPPPYP